MKNNNLENKNDNVCDVFDSYDDIVDRIKTCILKEYDFF